MNQVSLVGRLTIDPELKYTQNNKANTRIIIAVKRDKENSDFINCTAWNKTAELIAGYFKKGDMIAVTGNIKTGNYEKEGKKIYTTEIWINGITFLGGNKKESKEEETENNVESDEKDLEEEFPF